MGCVKVSGATRPFIAGFHAAMLGTGVFKDNAEERWRNVRRAAGAVLLLIMLMLVLLRGRHRKKRSGV
jgi:hypothetical protein